MIHFVKRFAVNLFIEDLKKVAKSGHRVRDKRGKKDKKEKFVLKKSPTYPDIIENFVYNELSLIKIKKRKLKE